jgi:hypothetical protein
MRRTIAVITLAFTTGCGARTVFGALDGGSIEDGPGGAGGGAPGDASGSCAAGTTTFHLTAADGRNSRYCVGLKCSNEWLAVRTLRGERMPLALGCNSTCEACRQVDCPAICPAPTPMKQDGERLVWDGGYWPDSTCAAGLSCRSKKCAPAGRYVARMCAGLGTSNPGMMCLQELSEKCVEMEFDFPSATTVGGAI